MSNQIWQGVPATDAQKVDIMSKMGQTNDFNAATLYVGEWTPAMEEASKTRETSSSPIMQIFNENSTGDGRVGVVLADGNTVFIPVDKAIAGWAVKYRITPVGAATQCLDADKKPIQGFFFVRTSPKYSYLLAGPAKEVARLKTANVRFQQEEEEAAIEVVEAAAAIATRKQKAVSALTSASLTPEQQAAFDNLLTKALATV